MILHLYIIASRRPGTSPPSSQFRGVPGNAVKVPPPFLPTVPGIPRSCDTSRVGSAGVDGMMNTQSARGEVTNPPARQSCNSNADGYYPVKTFMKYNRTRNHPAFSGQTYEQSRQGRP